MTGSEITVSGLETVADYGSDIDKVVEARFNQANSSGEIPGGRKIRYLPAVNDQGTADGALAGVRSLVEQQHVFGIVPELSLPLETSGGTYLDQQHVPTVGWGTSESFCSNDPSSDYLFGITGCLTPTASDLYAENQLGPTAAKYFELTGKGGAQGKTVAQISENGAVNKAGAAEIGSSFSAAGFNLVYNQSSLPLPPATVTDFTPYVLALMSSAGGKPPDVIELTTEIANALGLSRALKQAGYSGLIMSIYYAPQLTSAEAGQFAATTWATPESTAPAMQQIVSTLHSAGVTTIGLGELAAYFSADMFVQILKKVGTNLTPERFQQVAAHFTYGIPGVVGPTYYPEGFLVGSPCTQFNRSDGTKWSVAVPYTCYPTVLKMQGGKYQQVPYPNGVKF